MTLSKPPVHTAGRVWLKAEADNGRPYYWASDTNEVRWDRPPSSRKTDVPPLRLDALSETWASPVAGAGRQEPLPPVSAPPRLRTEAQAMLDAVGPPVRLPYLSSKLRKKTKERGPEPDEAIPAVGAMTTLAEMVSAAQQQQRQQLSEVRRWRQISEAAAEGSSAAKQKWAAVAASGKRAAKQAELEAARRSSETLAGFDFAEELQRKRQALRAPARTPIGPHQASPEPARPSRVRARRRARRRRQRRWASTCRAGATRRRRGARRSGARRRRRRRGRRRRRPSALASRSAPSSRRRRARAGCSL